MACAVVEALPPGGQPVHIDAYELDPELAALCTTSLHYAARWAAVERGLRITFTVHNTDFVLATADALDPSPLFGAAIPAPYDLAISNPPYFKLRKDDPQARAAAAVVHGQPNIYAIFMAIMAALLAPDGIAVTITPRSFSTGDYFRRFREHFFRLTTPEAVHLFDSRKDAFRGDEVLQENVILVARRAEPRRDATVWVSASSGRRDLSAARSREVPLADVVDLDSRALLFHIPLDEVDDQVVEFVRRWPETLHQLGLEVSTGPVVGFRARRFLRTEPNGTASTVPLLWIHNVRHGAVVWPIPDKKAQHIADVPESQYLLVPNRSYVLLRRFTAKEERRRLSTAPLFGGTVPGERVGLENHLNYIHRPKGTISDHEALGLSALLTSAVVDRYFRISNGNTQVNAVEIRALPLPHRGAIERIGAALTGRDLTRDQVEAAVADILRLPPALRQGRVGHGTGGCLRWG